MVPGYITPEGHRRLLEEYDHLLKVERPRITAEVAYAASLGDRSENAEYIYGKKRLREIDRRLHHLKKRLESLEVVDPAGMDGPTVRFGATVEIEDEDGRRQVVTIVGEDEVDTARGRISYRAPLGRALIGREEGDLVSFRTPGGTREVEIVSVRYPPPAGASKAG